MNLTGSPTPKRKPQRPSTRRVSRCSTCSSVPEASASERRRRRSSASPFPPRGARESYAPPPSSASGGRSSPSAPASAVTVCVTVPSPPAMATTRGRSAFTAFATPASSSGPRVSRMAAPGAALRSCCAASGHSRLRRAFGLAMIAIPAMAAPNTGQKPAAQGLFLTPASARLNVVLVEPKIPPNTGNVARLCAVTGSRLHLVAPLGFRIDDKDLRRAGLDYWDKVHAATWSSFDELLQSEGIVAARLHLFTGRGGTGLWEARFSSGDYLVLGDEVGGLPQPLLDRFVARQVRVPMIAEPSARSLNLSTCAGIAVYEALRQIHTAQPRGTSGEDGTSR